MARRRLRGMAARTACEARVPVETPPPRPYQGAVANEGGLEQSMNNNTQTTRLYHSMLSPFCRKVRLVLAENPVGPGQPDLFLGRGVLADRFGPRPDFANRFRLVNAGPFGRRRYA